MNDDTSPMTPSSGAGLIAKAGSIPVGVPSLTPEEIVWLQAFCAVASAFNSSSDVSIQWADKCLTAFQVRFRGGKYLGERQTSRPQAYDPQFAARFGNGT